MILDSFGRCLTAGECVDAAPGAARVLRLQLSAMHVRLAAAAQSLGMAPPRQLAIESKSPTESSDLRWRGSARLGHTAAVCGAELLNEFRRCARHYGVDACAAHAPLAAAGALRVVLLARAMPNQQQQNQHQNQQQNHNQNQSIRNRANKQRNQTVAPAYIGGSLRLRVRCFAAQDALALIAELPLATVHQSLPEAASADCRLPKDGRILLIATQRNSSGSVTACRALYEPPAVRLLATEPEDSSRASCSSSLSSADSSCDSLMLSSASVSESERDFVRLPALWPAQELSLSATIAIAPAGHVCSPPANACNDNGDCIRLLRDKWPESRRARGTHSILGFESFYNASEYIKVCILSCSL